MSSKFSASEYVYDVPAVVGRYVPARSTSREDSVARARRRSALVLVWVLAAVIGIAGARAASAAQATQIPAGALPSGFRDQIVLSGLHEPTNIVFAPDGHVFIAEKSGPIEVYDSISDPTPTLFADLSEQVSNYWDRGLLGLAVPPTFPASPWVYALYTLDARPGHPDEAPYYHDACSDAVGTDGNCIVTGQLVRLPWDPSGVMSGSPQVLVTDWCQQFPSHSIGDLQFGQDGALYVTAGDAASFYYGDDHGQYGNPPNPCGDPANEGGSLRAQDVRTFSPSDPTGFDGTMLRLDPETGAGMPDNPMAGSADPNARKIAAYGMRQPFRFTMRPGTNEAWIGDVGAGFFEEIDRVVPGAGAPNLGWPCFEGTDVHNPFPDLNLCQTLSPTSKTDPYFGWQHQAAVFTGDTCPQGDAAVTGLAFYPSSGGEYPASYRGGLFFADYTRTCIWFMAAPTAGALPDPNSVRAFATNVSSPVDLAVWDGVLYYVDFEGGTVRRYRYTGGNQPPTAVIATSTTGGPVPLTVQFDGTASSDVDTSDAGMLSYAWDFDGDGTTDSTDVVASHTYTTPGAFTATLTVTDTLGATDTASVLITPGNDAPHAEILTPTTGTTWAVGDTISFSGQGTDVQDGTVPDANMTWRLRMQHCTLGGSCHTHSIQTWSGVSSGTFVAPDHEYPSYLELELTVRDNDGLTNTTVRPLQPKTVTLTLMSSPPGLTVTAGDVTGAAPFTKTVIQGSLLTLTAPQNQTSGAAPYRFFGWSDQKDRTHTVTAPATNTTYTATYVSTRNVAAYRPATSDSRCSPLQGPEKAFNGTWYVGLTNRWCSTGANRWLRVDLGRNVSISGFTIRHAAAGREAPILNTRDYTIQVSTNGTSWTTVVSVTGNTAGVTPYAVVCTARYVRLAITRPTGNTDKAARIYEFQVFGV
jgi:glucose/arabinose dehydrogenase/PKD repeat protein